MSSVRGRTVEISLDFAPYVALQAMKGRRDDQSLWGILAGYGIAVVVTDSRAANICIFSSTEPHQDLASEVLYLSSEIAYSLQKETERPPEQCAGMIAASESIRWPQRMTKPQSSFFSLRVKPWGFFTAACAIASAATLFGFLGRLSWFFDLFSHFRVQYLFGLLALGVLLFIGRRRKTAVAFLALACVNLVLVLPLYFGKQNRPAEATPAIRALLLNVNTRLGDADLVREVIVAADPDIVVLEEISSRWMSDLAWLTNSHPYRITQPREDNFGIGIFSKLPLADGEVCYIGSADVPSILATVDIGYTNLRVVATHPLPPGGRDYSKLRNEQLGRLPDYVRSPFPVLLLGDLNVTPWSHHFRLLLARTGLRDSAKGYGVQPTWPNYNPLLRIPIDHCLHSTDIIIVDRRIGESVSSDHYPLIVDFVMEKSHVRKGQTTASTTTNEPAAGGSN